jgi:hypothetical protein
MLDIKLSLLAMVGFAAPRFGNSGQYLGLELSGTIGFTTHSDKKYRIF